MELANDASISTLLVESFNTPPDRNVAGITASIGSFTVKGQAFGSAGNTGDMFGILAEQIGKAKIGARTFAFKAGATKEAFFAAPTITGAGAENPAFDFIIREFGSTTPTITAAGPNLTLSTDSKTATFTDLDCDLVTVKRSLGTFSTGNFEKTNITIGENNNADSGIGAISVGRAWIAGSILASTTKGIDGFAGTGDDTQVGIGIDEPLRFSTIASILIKGQSLGTPADGDHYGIVAQQIGKAQIGSVKYAFKPTSNENFAAAPTGPGKGNFPFDTFDFYIRELL